MRWISIITVLFSQLFFSQSITQKLDAATQILLNSPNMTSANLSFYVADESGNLVYQYNGNKGLSTASTQKIFTAIMALEELGKDYRYTTTTSYKGEIKNGVLHGDLYLWSNGDPTLGSWRYPDFKPEDFQRKLISAIKAVGIKSIAGNLILDDSYFDMQTTPGGWPWNDMGNYYGAGVWGINWNENQFDMNIYGGKDVKSWKYPPVDLKWVNDVKPAGNFDNSIIYTAPFSNVALINGYLPSGKTLTVSGATPNPPLLLGNLIKDWLKSAGIAFRGNIKTYNLERINGETLTKAPENNVMLTYLSPTMDQMIYWFLQKSINLYGETFAKTFSAINGGDPSFERGVTELKRFWTEKGIQPAMINFKDGSGLSPQNYVSSKAEVLALLYAMKQNYFDIFYNALPTINGTKMKSGTISSSRAFAGYQKSSDGKTYVFSMIINNYDGGNIAGEMYRVLNVLK